MPPFQIQSDGKSVTKKMACCVNVIQTTQMTKPYKSKENGMAATATKISEMDSLTIVPTKINASLS